MVSIKRVLLSMSILGTGLALGACAASTEEPSTDGTPAVETPAAPTDQQAQPGGEKVGQQSDKWVVGYPGFGYGGFYGAPLYGGAYGLGYGGLGFGGWGIRRGFVGGWGYPGFGFGGVGCGGWGCF